MAADINLRSSVATHANTRADHPAATERKRIVSEIVFPYGDLEDAVEVSRALHHHFGYNCETDQLAAQLGTEAKHGTFRTKIGSARIFGAIEVGRGTVTLTELGARLADEQREKDGRVEAFLHVPLYERLYDSFHGRRLPSDKGLENEMRLLGVSPKQLSKARIAFQRSAEQAGFFAHGNDRLVRPASTPTESATVSAGAQVTATGQSAPSEDMTETNGLHPLLAGLIKTIPREGEPFSSRRQRQWLEAAKVNFALIFGSDDDETPKPRATPGPDDPGGALG